MKISKIIALAAIAMVSKTATAQTIVAFTENQGKQCYEYLSQNPTDTAKIVTNDGNVIGKLYFPNGDISNPVFVEQVVVNKTVVREVIDPQLVQEADTARVNNMTQFLLSGATNNRQYDIYWAETPAGKVPVKWAKKYGFHLQAGIGASYTKENFSPNFSLGALYDRARWGVLVEGAVAKTQLSSAAEHAGNKYWTYSAQATLRYRPFQIDANDINRLFLYAGCGWEWYKTDSPDKGDHFKSWGNYLYGVFGVGFTHRFFANAQDLGICFEYHTSGAVRQNTSFENYGTFVLKATYSFNLFPNKASVKNLGSYTK